MMAHQMIDAKAESLATLLVEIDKLEGEDREDFREAFISLADAEGHFEIGPAIAFLKYITDEAYA